MSYKELFRTSNDDWCIMEHEKSSSPWDPSIHAYHIQCDESNRQPGEKIHTTWGWLVDDTYDQGKTVPTCYLCGDEVPEQIQGLMRMYIGR